MHYLTEGDKLLCIHGGTITPKPQGERSMKLNGKPVLVEEDVLNINPDDCDCKGFPGGPPCTKVTSILIGKAQNITVDGEAPLLDTLMVITDAGMAVVDPASLKQAAERSARVLLPTGSGLESTSDSTLATESPTQEHKEDEDNEKSQEKQREDQSWIYLRIIERHTQARIPKVRLRVTLADGQSFIIESDGNGEIRRPNVDKGIFTLEGITLDEMKKNPPSWEQLVGGPHKARVDDQFTLEVKAIPTAQLEKEKEKALKPISLPNQLRPDGTVNVARIETHRVQDNDTLNSLAQHYGTDWKVIAHYNWGTTEPERINAALRDEVGCTQMDKENKNYRFSSKDVPGIVFIPIPWSQEKLETGKHYLLQVELMPAYCFSLGEKSNFSEKIKYDIRFANRDRKSDQGSGDTIKVEISPWDKPAEKSIKDQHSLGCWLPEAANKLKWPIIFTLPCDQLVEERGISGIKIGQEDSLSHLFGDAWPLVYYHPDNQEFRRKNPNPDQISPNDLIRIPHSFIAPYPLKDQCEQGDGERLISHALDSLAGEKACRSEIRLPRYLPFFATGTEENQCKSPIPLILSHEQCESVDLGENEIFLRCPGSAGSFAVRGKVKAKLCVTPEVRIGHQSPVSIKHNLNDKSKFSIDIESPEGRKYELEFDALGGLTKIGAGYEMSLGQGSFGLSWSFENGNLTVKYKVTSTAKLIDSSTNNLSVKIEFSLEFVFDDKTLVKALQQSGCAVPNLVLIPAQKALINLDDVIEWVKKIRNEAYKFLITTAIVAGVGIIVVWGIGISALALSPAAALTSAILVYLHVQVSQATPLPINDTKESIRLY